MDYRGSQGSQTSELVDEHSLPARKKRYVFGMSDTMGGSDSDVPDELRFILASHSERNSVAESLSF